MATITWTGAAGDGNYNNPANWSPQQVPGTADTVTISTSAATAITVGDAGAGNLTINKFVSLNLSNNATFTLGSGTNTTFSNAGTFALDSNYNNTDLILNAPKVTFSGGGTILLNNYIADRIYGAAASDVFNNVNNQIVGGGQLGAGQMTLQNGVAGKVIANDGTQLIVNTGTISVANSGLMEATAASAGLVLQSNIVNSSTGTLLGAGGIVYLQNMTVTGGTLATTTGGEIAVSGSATLNGVTNTGSLVLQNNTTLTLLGTIANAGSINLESSYNNTDLIVGSGSTASTVTVSGTGTINMGDYPANHIYGAVAADTLINQETITGAGQLGNGQLTLINDGTINASAVTNALVLNTGTTVINKGLIESTNTGALVIQSTIDGSSGGTVASAGGTVYLSAGGVIGGTLKGASLIDNGGFTLDGSSHAVTNLGSLAVSNNATLYATGSIVNKGSISLGSTYNNTDLSITGAGATFSGGGTITMGDYPANRLYAGAGVTVTNLANTIQGAGDIGANTGMILVNDATIDANGANVLYLDGEKLVTNNALIEATGAGGLTVLNTTVNDSGGGTLLASGGNISLQGATVIGGTLSSTGTNALYVTSTAVLDGSAQAVTNSGTVFVEDNTSLDLAGSIVNHGTISLNSNYHNTFLTIGPADGSLGTVTLTGHGNILLSDYPANYIQAVAAGDTLINVDNTISGAGYIGNSQLNFTNQSVVDATGNYALVINSTGVVTNTALMESSNTGTSGSLGLYIEDTIANKGGTISAAGGNVYLQGADIQGGTLTSTGGAVLAVTNSATLDGSASALVNLGTVYVEDNTSLNVLGTIDNVGTISLNSNYHNTFLNIGAGTVTLTGAGNLTLSNYPANYIQGTDASSTLLNVNNTISGAGVIGNGGLNFINQATVDANGTYALVINSTGAVTNTGLMESTNTGGLVIEDTISNQGGTISAAGGNVYLQGGDIKGGTLTSSGGASFVVNTSATLDGTAGTLVNRGSVYVGDNQSLYLLGAIANSGTISVNSNYHNTFLYIGTGTTTLTGGGNLTLSNYPANYIQGVDATSTLDNVNNTISGAGYIGNGQLNLITGGAVEATGSYGLQIDLGSGTGSITATGSFLGIGSGGLQIASGTFTNAGLIEAQDGSSVAFQSGATLTNDVAGVLTGGTYEAAANGHGATLQFYGTPIATDAANLILSGAGAVIETGTTNLGASLKTISSKGTLQIDNGAAYTGTVRLTDSGKILLSAGNLTDKKGIVVKAASLISGNGTITGNLTSAGTITATGGTLELKGTEAISGAVTGTGTLALDGKVTTLSAGASLTVSEITMISNASLLLDTSISFAGILDIVGAGTIANGTGGAFTNTGIFEETGKNIGTVSAPFTNAGTISIGTGGGLAFSGGLTNTGTILDSGTFTDTAALTGGTLNIAKTGAATIASAAGTGPSTLANLDMAGGTLNTSGTTVTVTHDYNNAATGTGNAYLPFAGVTGTIDGQGTQLTVVGVNGTTITMVNGVETITIAPGGHAQFEIVNAGATGSAELRGALQTSVNGGHITGTALTGNGVTAANFGPIAAGAHSGIYTIDYSSGTLSGEAIHLASDFANVAGITIDIVSTAQASSPGGSFNALNTPPSYGDLIPLHH